ncbi:MAG: tRNA dihydrouridine(20/20a) synthase DusA [Burkholderiaceae bacterium]|nr:MAG: tRNA dihydrouridine(20/20a) synthase DusA [Burkholderiaceae bacterium]
MSRRISVAPMMDWTDRHCRFFHRALSRHAWLYTEMVTTGALLHGDVPRHLDFSSEEHPVALQLGGSEPDDLAACAKLAAQWGYDEVNLNCGCPSERVQRGAFGACLMAEPQLVTDCVKAMRDAVDLPITVKHRIGIDKSEDYAFVRDFVGTVAQAGCTTFIVHARNAVLKGLSPKQNREVPPLKYEFAYQLKKDFPALEILINGGITTYEQIDTHLQHVDGVMLGREAYHNPGLLTQIDRRYYDPAAANTTMEAMLEIMDVYLQKITAAGEPPRHLVRHMLGLFHGLPGARNWRRILSETALLEQHGAQVLRQAFAEIYHPHPPLRPRSIDYSQE